MGNYLPSIQELAAAIRYIDAEFVIGDSITANHWIEGLANGRPYTVDSDLIWLGGRCIDRAREAWSQLTVAEWRAIGAQATRIVTDDGRSTWGVREKGK